MDKVKQFKYRTKELTEKKRSINYTKAKNIDMYDFSKGNNKPEIMEDKYRKSILKTVDYLMEVRHNLFSNAVNIALNNDLKEINKISEAGEKYEFQIEHSDNSSATNLQKIADLIKDIEIALVSIMNINNIDDSELGQER